MCEGSFLPSSFGPHQKHTEFESSLRSYPINPCSDWLHITGFLSAATDRRDDRNLRSGGDRTHKPAGISNIFVSDKDIDVFPNLSLLGCDAISNARVEYPQRRQRVGQRSGRVFYFNCTASSSEFAQGARNVKSHRHNQPFFVGRDLRVVADFVGDEIERRQIEGLQLPFELVFRVSHVSARPGWASRQRTRSPDGPNAVSEHVRA